MIKSYLRLTGAIEAIPLLTTVKAMPVQVFETKVESQGDVKEEDVANALKELTSSRHDGFKGLAQTAFEKLIVLYPDRHITFTLDACHLEYIPDRVSSLFET